MDRLVVHGAREHNLKNVTVSIPRGKITAFIGPSGSGKSSLVFDTIYAEAQRRYVESLRTHARQFIEQLPKPDVDSIDGLSPAIALEQRPLTRSQRSTVGTVTEITDYLRLLFARVGIPHCPKCGQRIQAQTPPQIVDRILEQKTGTRLSILAPICRGRKGELRLEIDRLRRDGYVRALIDGVSVDLGDDLDLHKTRPHDLDVVVDRVVLKEGVRQRLSDSVELSLRLGDGQMLYAIEGESPVLLSEHYACTACGISLPPLEPRFFSFNGPTGACPNCDGLGETAILDAARAVGDATLSLRAGVLLPWGPRGSVAYAEELARAVKGLKVDPDVPWKRLSESEREALLFGSKKHKWGGVDAWIHARLEGSTETEIADGALSLGELEEFLRHERCPDCKGSRLRKEALSVTIGGTNIAEIARKPIAEVVSTFDNIAFEPPEIAAPILTEIRSRLRFLLDVGLEYLSLDRTTNQLSSGEGQRIRLATQLGSSLSGVLYVLDEPTVGLHPRDQERLFLAEARLRDLGNTVLVVEHQRAGILAADHVVELGLGAGKTGGAVLATGSPKEIASNPDAPSARFLSTGETIGGRAVTRPPDKSVLRIRGATLHNLQNVDVDLPLGRFVCVTGVSGSGKSSLILDTLLPMARASCLGSTLPALCRKIEGLGSIDKVLSIDQSPIGRSPRSNPATYAGIMGELRDLFASLPEARARGYRAGRFSFNTKGGRCEACEGDGVRRIEMHLLPDVFVMCEECRGKRYDRETLEVRYRGLSIADVLTLSVDEARNLFEVTPRIKERLDGLRRVGLGYLPLGQSGSTLSGGEAQRLKLGREFAKRSTGKTLYVLDEPTAGLHFSDVAVLLSALFDLRDQGNTILVIEHHLDVIRASDWIVDLGPEAGERGGRVVATGTPEEIARHPQSHTGRYLRQRL